MAFLKRAIYHAWPVAILCTICGCARPQPTPQSLDVATFADQPPDRGSCPRPQWPVGVDRTSSPDTVVAQFVLDTTGHVAPGTLTILRSTNPSLDQEALSVVRRCHYKAARRNGDAVAVRIQQAVVF